MSGGGREYCDISDEKLVTHAIGQVAEILHEAAWGHSTWTDVCAALEETLPGSAATFVNYDFARGRVVSSFFHGLDRGYVNSYLEYYYSINPWNEFWQGFPSGMVGYTERDRPAAAIRNTEFYTDWLRPLGNMDAAVGIKMALDPHNSVHFAWNYGLSQSPSYDRLAGTITSAIAPHVENAVRNEVLVRTRIEEARRLGSILEELDGAAFMIDGDRAIREMNNAGSEWLRAGGVVAGTGNVLAFVNGVARRWLEDTAHRLVRCEFGGRRDETFRIGDKLYRVTATLAPGLPDVSHARLVRPKQLILVVVKVLVGGASLLDERLLRNAFALSLSEMKLCQILVNGHSLQEAAEMLELAEGTVRQRVKLIFQKTRTRRQGELVALLTRFSRSV